MDYKKLLKIGEVFTNEYVVEEYDTADAGGNKGVRVLSTPALLKYIEVGSTVKLFQRLPEGYSPVGVYINLRHIGATPVNGVIEVVSQVESIQGKRCTYKVEVFYNDKKIAEGTYGQAIVYLEEFLQKNNVV